MPAPPQPHLTGLDPEDVLGLLPAPGSAPGSRTSFSVRPPQSAQGSESRAPGGYYFSVDAAEGPSYALVDYRGELYIQLDTDELLAFVRHVAGYEFSVDMHRRITEQQISLDDRHSREPEVVPESA